MIVAKKLEKLIELYHGNKLSHVYLLETNNLDLAMQDILTFVKTINCQNKFKDNCFDCNLCNLVDKLNLPSLIIIEPDGNMIKKEQVIDLKKRFSFKPVYTQNNIYIIKNADKLNGASANTMLKFIEEPGEAIIGFLLTTNINNVLPTIKSRCELLSLIYDNLDTKNDDNAYDNIANEYLQKIELEKVDKIMYNRDIILNYYSERNEIEAIFKEIFNIYMKAYNSEKVSYLSHLTFDDIRYRIKLVSNLLENINYNANIELLMDKFVIELSDRNESI